jgi:GH24 family phage-related lysozyme (muramidase)
MLKADEPKSEIAAQFLRWNKAGGKVLAGLTRRRNAEAELFLSE